MADMNYETALIALYQGEQIARRLWKGTPILVYRQGDGDDIRCRDVQGKLLAGWQPSESDSAAEDWYVVVDDRVEVV